MALLKRETPANLPVKVLQFGEGNFLRAFIDWMINEMNKQGKFNGMVRLIQPLEKGMGDMINAQDGLYTLILRGVENGKVIENHEIIRSVKDCLNPYHQWADTVAAFCEESVRFVFSNTTEAGIEFKEEPYTSGKCQNTYPAKVTSLLFERFKAGRKGLNFLPCELIDKNGATLRACILKYIELWNLPAEFAAWVKDSNTFFNTLVVQVRPFCDSFYPSEYFSWSSLVGGALSYDPLSIMTEIAKEKGLDEAAAAVRRYEEMRRQK